MLNALAHAPGLRVIEKMASRLAAHGAGVNGQKSVSRPVQALEQVVLRMKRRLGTLEYYMYGLHDRRFSWSDKSAFMSVRDFVDWWQTLNPLDFHALLNNKLIFKRLITGLGLPTPPLLAVYDPIEGETRSGMPFRNAEDIARWIHEERIE